MGCAAGTALWQMIGTGRYGMAETMIPNVLTIAGVDPSGGAGTLADVKAISANGAYACADRRRADRAEHAAA